MSFSSRYSVRIPLLFLIGLFVFSSSFSQEYDDMYFNGDDRAAQEDRSFLQKAPKPVVNKEEYPENAEESYSSKTVNPEYLSRYQSSASNDIDVPSEEESIYYENPVSNASYSTYGNGYQDYATNRNTLRDYNYYGRASRAPFFNSGFAVGTSIYYSNAYYGAASWNRWDRRNRWGNPYGFHNTYDPFFGDSFYDDPFYANRFYNDPFNRFRYSYAYGGWYSRRNNSFNNIYCPPTYYSSRPIAVREGSQRSIGRSNPRSNVIGTTSRRRSNSEATTRSSGNGRIASGTDSRSGYYRRTRQSYTGRSSNNGVQSSGTNRSNSSYNRSRSTSPTRSSGSYGRSSSSYNRSRSSANSPSRSNTNYGSKPSSSSPSRSRSTYSPSGSRSSSSYSSGSNSRSRSSSYSSGSSGRSSSGGSRSRSSSGSSRSRGGRGN